MISLLMQKFQRKKVVGAAVLLLLALCGNICAQDTTRYANVLRGYEFDFSNADFPKYPVFKWVYPGSSAAKMTLTFALIDNVNGKDLDKLPKAEIIQLMLSEDTSEMTLRHHGCRSKEVCKNPPKEWKHKWEDPNPKTFTLRQLNGPARRKHPLGECIYGDCWNGEGYVLLKPDGPEHKKGDSFKGTFKEGRPDSGNYVFHGIYTTLRNGKAPDGAFTKNAAKSEPVKVAGPVKPAIDSVNAAFLRVCGYEPKPQKKVQAWDVTQPVRMLFERDVIYEGELWGHTPHGKGKLVYDQSSVPAPLPDAYAYKMITEGQFAYGDCQKIEQLYVQNFSGYYVKGEISVRLDWFHNKWDWYCYNCTLYNMGYHNAQWEYIRKDVPVFEGNYAAGLPYGKGKWLYNQQEADPLYGAYIEMDNIQEGFIKDSVVLVIPSKNYRKAVVIDPPYWIPLENIADYVTARYMGDKRSAINWKRGLPIQPVVKKEEAKDLYEVFYKEIVKQYKETDKQHFYPEEGIVYPDGKLVDKHVHVSLESGKSVMVLVFSINETKPEVEQSDAVEPSKYVPCKGTYHSNINADKNYKANIQSGCTIFNSTLKTNTYTFKIRANTTMPIYYLVVRS